MSGEHTDVPTPGAPYQHDPLNLASLPAGLRLHVDLQGGVALEVHASVVAPLVAYALRAVKRQLGMVLVDLDEQDEYDDADQPDGWTRIWLVPAGATIGGLCQTPSPYQNGSATPR